jgi:arylformamidase
MKYIDLTMPLNPSTPVYPGDPSVEVIIAAELGEAGYLDHVIKLGTHNGTHIDAPAHMVAGGKLLKDFAVERFIGPAKLIDVRKGFDHIDLSTVNPGDIVLLRTTMSDDYKSAKYYLEYPEIPSQLASELVSKKVKMVGVDSGSIDHEPFKTHKTLLGADVLIIENLVNLSLLVNESFKVIALPLNLSVEGSPARVIAEIE